MTPRLRRALAVAWFAIGVALSLPFAGCSALATRSVHRAIEGLAVHEEVALDRIERLAIARGDDGRHAIEVVERLADGGTRVHRAREDWASAPERPVTPFEPGAAAVVALGPCEFALGASVHALARDGRLAATATPLTAALRERAWLFMVTQGRDQRRYVWIYAPPAAGRPADAALPSLHPWMRCPFEPPLTTGSRAQQVALAIVGYPLAFAVDVVTWPLQAVAVAWTLSRVPVH